MTPGLLAQTGVTVLLPALGLKLDLNQIRHIGAMALATGLGQLAFTITFGFLLILLQGKFTMKALYMVVRWVLVLSARGAGFLRCIAEQEQAHDCKLVVVGKREQPSADELPIAARQRDQIRLRRGQLRVAGVDGTRGLTWFPP